MLRLSGRLSSRANFSEPVRAQVIFCKKCAIMADMAKLTTAMKEFVADQRLAFLATICPDGSPNLSPKGLTFILDDSQIVIGEVRSPNSIKNLLAQPMAELNVVDRNLRKGYRFKGSCVVYKSGDEFDRLTNFMRSKGAISAIQSIIVMTVEHANPILSPVYDRGVSEAEVGRQWKRHYDSIDSDCVGK